MNPHRFLRIGSLSMMAMLLSIIATGTLCPVFCATSRAEPDDERDVLEQIQNDKESDLDGFLIYITSGGKPGEQRLMVSAAFFANLLTGHNRATIHRKRILIRNVVVYGELDLRGQDIPYDVFLGNCTFENAVDFSGSHFAKGFLVWACTFKNSVDFTGATMTEAFFIYSSTFQLGKAEFVRMQVDDGIRISDSRFSNEAIYFTNMRVGRMFTVENTSFNSVDVSFADLRVEGRFSVQGCTFSFNDGAFAIVRFSGAHVGDFFLNDSSFDNISTIDFTRLQADLMSLDRVRSTTPSNIKLELMTFKLLRPVDAKQLRQFLLAKYDPELYTEVETSLRTHGYLDQADDIFIAKKRAERHQDCEDFLRQCNHGAWAFSLFEDMLAGYGKSLQNLLYWSLGFLVLGMFVFRSETGMRTKDPNEAENYEGKYHAFWYSLDLFLPIIKLGEADVWTPKDYRRWANLYRKLHIIIGSLFVPIGLAAWTGIIK